MNNNQNTVDWRTDSHALKKYQFIYHFLPHPVEKRRATLLLGKSLFIYCLLILSVGLTFRIMPSLLPGILGFASNINTTDLLKYTNEQRGQAGVGSLKLNNALSVAAQRKAADMFKKNYWAHVSPSGTQPWDFILGAGYDYVYAGENLAKNFSNSKDVVKAWYNSSSHKQNLLNGNYVDVGFASVNGVLNGYETTIVVQMFGKPRYITADVNAPVIKKETEQIAVVEEVPSTVPTTVGATSQIVEQPITLSEVQVNPTVDVRKATKTLSAIFAGFLIVLLSLDLWYSKKMGITKINGHTLAHISFLVLVVLSIWFVLKPGAIL